MFLEREACRWASRRRGAWPSCAAPFARLPRGTPVETGVFSHAVLVDDPLEQLEVARHYALHVAAMYPPLPRRAARRHDGRLRIGYLSADFHQHATSQLMVEMLECHDRSRFEVTLLSTGPDDKTALRQRVVAASEHFEELRGLGFEQVAARIRKLGIDILVDLKGATHDTLLPVLAQRPAPLQVGWLGFPGTSGAPYIDYFIGDAVVAPLADAAHFSEQIAQLPHCYQPNDSQACAAAAVEPRRVGPARRRVRPVRVPPVVQDLGRGVRRLVRAAAPRSRLACSGCCSGTSTSRPRSSPRRSERGIDAERLRFAPLLPLQGHVSRLAHADVFLDTWPCNGHTTAGEALWVGVPVVTLRGATFAQRVAASLLHAVGLDQLVCSDVAGYAATAVALAADRPRRAALRAAPARASARRARCSTARASRAASRRSTCACGRAPSPARRRRRSPPRTTRASVAAAAEHGAIAEE